MTKQQMALLAQWPLPVRELLASGATLCEASHPCWPQQNYNLTNQDLAMAFIEVMAAREAEDEIVTAKC